MPAKHSPKEIRQAQHIVESEKDSGKSTKRSKQIAWATVNKVHKSKGASLKDHSSSASRSH